VSPEGATQSPGSEIHLSWTHRTPAREEEARAFAAEVGVPESNLHFHAGEDGRVCEQLGELLPSFQAMMAEVRPDVVVCAAFEQGHLDHDATHWLVTHSFDGPVFEYPMYHPYTRRIQTMGRFEEPAGFRYPFPLPGQGEGARGWRFRRRADLAPGGRFEPTASDPGIEEILALTPEEGRFKNRLSKTYRSQNIRSVVLWYSIYRCLCLKPAQLRRYERLRPVEGVDYLTPNLPAPLRGEVERSEMWRRWVAAVRTAG
jgi:hypothetical protein